MSLWGHKPFVAVRLLGTHGHYPSFDIRTPSHLFVSGDKVCWSAVVQPALPDDWELGESTALVPEEVRLYSAIALSEADPWTNGRPIITHWADKYLDIGPDQCDLQSPELFARLEETVAQFGAPPIIASFGRPNGSPYMRSDVGSRDDALSILENVDASDQLLLAGLARLLGGTRLIFAAHEMEEAALSLFVSMGASLEFLRLCLAEQQSQDAVSFDAVYQYLSEVYPADSGVAEYYEYMYEHRLAATHPANRLGEFWAPPLMADDIYHLQKHLTVLYRHIALGERPQFEC